LEKLIVVALGGNAIQKEGESATAETQYKNIRNACEHIIKLVKNGYKVVITHGMRIVVVTQTQHRQLMLFSFLCIQET